MNSSNSSFLRRCRQRIPIVLLLVAVIAGVLTRQHWMPVLSGPVRSVIAVFQAKPDAVGDDEESTAHDPHAGHDHEGHDHAAHGGHRESASLELSEQAMRNIGLTADEVRPVTLEVFRRTITVPAVVVEKPGRTRIQVATPMTGAVTQIHAVEGESVNPGSLLFRIRLTHEDLVQAQTGFVQTLGELDVEQREITRLEEITKSGAIAGKMLLDRKYAAGRLMALLTAQREALRLHGLSEQQVEQIEVTRRLLRELQMFAPAALPSVGEERALDSGPTQSSALVTPNDADHAEAGERTEVPLILQDLSVHVGQSVDAGDSLCVLTDFSELYIEGMAFEYDIAVLREASRRNWDVAAVLQRGDQDNEVVDGLNIAYLANEVDTESRTLRFYVDLRNTISSDRMQGDRRFVEWRYFPGQRLQLEIPVEEWPDRMVLPVDAVAREGAEYFVFRQNGKFLDRVAVHVEFRDQRSVVIANDGALFPGDFVAMSGAHQMQMALKNKAGGAPDPHAGHNH